MGWFSKKQNTRESGGNYNDIPPLPQIPELSSYSNENTTQSYEMTELPIIPSNTMGQKFSESIIKDAVSSNQNQPIKSSRLNEFSREVDDEFQPVQFKSPALQKIPPQSSLILPPAPEQKLPPIQRIEIPKINELPKLEETPKPKSKESVPIEFKEAADKVKSSQPVFIRIDKFQRALEIIDETQDKINEMKKNLNEIKKIREEEDIELETWDNEISKLKEKISKIDEELFSRIE